jgi:hypothetical protein
MSTTHVQERHVQERHVQERRGPRQRRQHHGPFALPLLWMGLAIAAALAFVLHVLWSGWQGSLPGPDVPALPITVAGVPFNVPPAAIRVAMQRQPGAQERVDLAFLWPSLLPPKGTPLPNVPTKGLPKVQTFERIFVTIAAARESLSPAERVKSVYPRYLEVEAAAGPGGLAMIAFRHGTPYQGEDLIYDETAPDNFLVRCSRNGAGATPGMCLHVRRIGEADVTARFPRDWLTDWREVAGNIEQLIAKLRPAGG